MSFVRKFYVADTHFGHSRIIESCGRPFSSTGEMDEYMIREWNSVVGYNDIVYHLGDFAMGLQDEDRIQGIFNRLNGRKALILGNHDYKKPNAIHPTLARFDWFLTPTPSLETNDGGLRVYLSHYAHRTWPGSHKGSVHFYGHSHGKCPPLGRSRDVGVDVKDVAFRPRTFTELTKGMTDV